MKFKKGDTVRQIMPKPITGTVEKFSVDPDTGALQVLVVWPDEDGDGVQESRFFSPDQIEVAGENP